MELMKKNIHMDRIRMKAVSQITLEEEIDLPGQKPDMESLCLEKGTVLLDEVKTYSDYVQIRGRLCYRALYHTTEDGCALACLEGKIAFEEKINLSGTVPGDTVRVETQTEDLTMRILQSRKLGVQALLTFRVCAEELYDVEAPVEINGEEHLEYRKRSVEVAQLSLRKKDTAVIKEEVTLPQGYPAVNSLLWYDLTCGDMEWKMLEEMLALQGQLQLFLLYEGEGEDHPIRSYECSIPFHQNLECRGCEEDMIPDMITRVVGEEITVRPDLDGEQRILAAELTMDLALKLYKEEDAEFITDVYGTDREVEPSCKEENLRRLLSKVTGKMNIAERMKMGHKDMVVLQMLHSVGEAYVDKWEITEAGIEIRGSLKVKALCVAGTDDMPYGNISGQFPYHYIMEVPGITPEDTCEITCEIEQLRVTMAGGDEMDVKAQLVFQTMLFRSTPVELISEIGMQPIDTGKLAKLPGMVLYVVKPGDTLWNIGKKYYLSVDRIRELNRLVSDDLMPGQKLLLMKGGVIS